MPSLDARVGCVEAPGAVRSRSVHRDSYQVLKDVHKYMQAYSIHARLTSCSIAVMQHRLSRSKSTLDRQAAFTTCAPHSHATANRDTDTGVL